MDGAGGGTVLELLDTGGGGGRAVDRCDDGGNGKWREEYLAKFPPNFYEFKMSSVCSSGDCICSYVARKYSSRQKGENGGKKSPLQPKPKPRQKAQSNNSKKLGVQAEASIFHRSISIIDTIPSTIHSRSLIYHRQTIKRRRSVTKLRQSKQSTLYLKHRRLSIFARSCRDCAPTRDDHNQIQIKVSTNDIRQTQHQTPPT
jgi:hypothetical protein